MKTKYNILFVLLEVSDINIIFGRVLWWTVDKDPTCLSPSVSGSTPNEQQEQDEWTFGTELYDFIIVIYKITSALYYQHISASIL